MNKKRIIQRAGVAAGVLVVLCAILLLRPKTGELSLINEAQESIIKTTVEINHEKFDFADIPPGAIRKMKFKIEADNHYTVTVEFRYERTLELQTGYFSDREPSHELIIKHDEVVLESGAD
jgi:hypothetical protein